MEKKYNFNSMIINNSYFEWIEQKLMVQKAIMNVHGWGYNLDKDDANKYEAMDDLVKKLLEFKFKFNKPILSLTEHFIRYNGNVYRIYYDYEAGYICEKVSSVDDNLITDYDEFRKFCKKNMKDNFEHLKSRITDSLNNTDLEKINSELLKIEHPTLVSGVGGSSVVSEYASKILNSKNHIITRNMEPRDFKYFDKNSYKNVIACSYSGNNYGVELAFLNNLKHYLLSSKKSEDHSTVNLTYECLDPERSFISLAATLIPCSIMLNYYLDNDKEKIIDSLNSYNFNFDTKCDAYEIFSGIETSTASKYLESTMLESGIGIPIVHDKYSYCHGRSTISMVNNNIAIYFNNNTELDKVLLKELPKYYKDIVVLDTKPDLLSEYILLVKCMYLTKYIAQSKHKDLSGVDYNPIVKKLYKYNGDL